MKIRSWQVGLIGSFLFGVNADAFKLTPITVTLAPSGSKASANLFLENSNPEKTAIQISMVHRIMKEDGTEDLKPADDDFIVHPNQVILEPKEKRVLRITWSGDPKPKSELSYRIIAEQLPIDGIEKKKKGNIQIKLLMKYQGSVYIEPENVNSKIIVESVRIDAGKLSFSVKNIGSKHQILKSPVLNLIEIKKDSKKSSVLTSVDSKSLPGVDGENVLAGATRKFEVPSPADLKPEYSKRTDLTYELKFQAE